MKRSDPGFNLGGSGATYILSVIEDNPKRYGKVGKLLSPLGYISICIIIRAACSSLDCSDLVLRG